MDMNTWSSVSLPHLALHLTGLWSKKALKEAVTISKRPGLAGGELGVWMYVCVPTNVCLCPHVPVCVHIWTQVCSHTGVGVCACVNPCICIPMCMYVCVYVYVWCHLTKWKESCLPGNLPALRLIFPWQHFIHCIIIIILLTTFFFHTDISNPLSYHSSLIQRLPCLSVSIGSPCRSGKILSYNFNLVPSDVSTKIERKREGKKCFRESYVTAILLLSHLCLS